LRPSFASSWPSSGFTKVRQPLLQLLLAIVKEEAIAVAAVAVAITAVLVIKIKA